MRYQNVAVSATKMFNYNKPCNTEFLSLVSTSCMGKISLAKQCNIHSGETPPGVLSSALEPSAQERQGPVGADPEEGHKNDQRDGTPLL